SSRRHRCRDRTSSGSGDLYGGPMARPRQAVREMIFAPNIAGLVDREWCGVHPVPSERGEVTAVRWMPGELRGPGWRPAYWIVCIGGQWWGIRPSDPIECTALDMFARSHWSQ